MDRKPGQFWFKFERDATIWPQSDEVFDPFTTNTSILSSNFWSENSCDDRDMIKIYEVFNPFTADTSISSSNFGSGNCHDRDMIKIWWGFQSIYRRHVHLELELWVRKLSRSWHDQNLMRFSIHLPQTRPFWARTFGPEIATIVTWPKIWTGFRSTWWSLVFFNITSLLTASITVSPRPLCSWAQKPKRGATCPAGVF